MIKIIGMLLLGWVSVLSPNQPIIGLGTNDNNVVVVLDGYAYEIFGDIEIELNTVTVSFPSDISNCISNINGTPNAGNGATLVSGSEVIGLVGIRYNVPSRILFLTSIDGDVICDYGTFVDVIFSNGFEDIIFNNGFESIEGMQL